MSVGGAGRTLSESFARNWISALKAPSPQPAGPSFLPLLNALCLAQRRGAQVLGAWRDQTADRRLARVLNQVAIRQTAHAAAFAKRLGELGGAVRGSTSDAFPRALALARSEADDAEKLRCLLGPAGADPLGRLLEDPAIDPHTGALLGRFIAESRDSERLLRGACQRSAGCGA